MAESVAAARERREGTGGGSLGCGKKKENTKIKSGTKNQKIKNKKRKIKTTENQKIKQLKIKKYKKPKNQNNQKPKIKNN